MTRNEKALAMLNKWNGIAAVHIWNANWGRVARIAARLERVAKFYAAQ